MKPISATLVTVLIVLAASTTVFAFPPPGGGGPRPAPGGGSRPSNPSQHPSQGPQPPQEQTRWVRVHRSPLHSSDSEGGGWGSVVAALLCLTPIFLFVIVGVGLAILLTWMTSKKRRGARRNSATPLPCDDLPDAVEARWNPSGHR